MSPDAPEIEVLRRGRWFASLPPALQARIPQLGVLRRFRAGQCVVREGDLPRGMFGLIQGRTRHVCAVGEEDFVCLISQSLGPFPTVPTTRCPNRHDAA